MLKYWTPGTLVLAATLSLLMLAVLAWLIPIYQVASPQERHHVGFLIGFVGGYTVAIWLLPSFLGWLER